MPFVDKVVDCPLLCSLGDGPDSAVMRSSGQGVDLPVVVQVQGWSRHCTVRAVLGQGR